MVASWEMPTAVLRAWRKVDPKVNYLVGHLAEQRVD
jgi:hypothetical protein